MEHDAMLYMLSIQGYAVFQDKSMPAVLEVATSLGVPQVERRDPRVYRVISPTPVASAKPNTLSSRYGTGPFPFHSDTAYWVRPARYLLLHCLSPGASRRPTLLLDSSEWRLSPSESQLLQRGLWIAGDKRPFLSTILQSTKRGLLLRYDQDCMQPASASGNMAQPLIRSRIFSSQPVEIRWQVGMLLIIDNHRMLHSRGAAAQPDLDRRLGRVLVGDSK